jgi:drug/metabolite transporter (DMT)-like permease
MNPLSVIYLAVVVLAGTGGHLATKHALRCVGEVERLRPGSILHMLAQVIRQPWFWTGIVSMTISFFSLLALLAREPLSLAVPATALSYVVGTLGARLLLDEQVSTTRWLGVLLVCVGVTLISLG